VQLRVSARIQIQTFRTDEHKSQRTSAKPEHRGTTSHLQVEAHDVRRFLSSAVAIGVHVARTIVNSFDCLLLGFDELHVYDGHFGQHLETNVLANNGTENDSKKLIANTFMGGASTNVAKSISQNVLLLLLLLLLLPNYTPRSKPVSSVDLAAFSEAPWDGDAALLPQEQ
jgi:hypothetical protein